MTRGRLRRGIVLALAGLIGGFGIVLGVHWIGGLVRLDDPATQGKVPAMSPEANLGLPPGGLPAPQGEVTGENGKPAERGQSQLDAVAPVVPPVTITPKEKAAEADAPRFDIVRVEPNGDAVVAGRGKPNTVVEMLVDGKPVARALADPNGQFAIIPPALPKGSSEITLRSKTADGQEARSSQTVAVSVSPEGTARPLVALTAPDAPTVVLSQPGAPATPPAATAQAGNTEAKPDGGDKKTADQAKPDEPVRIVSVDAEPGGRLFVTGTGKAGTDVRLYLNDTLIAPARIGTDGRVTFTIGSGVAMGRYQVRIDEVDPKSNRVLRRAEVPFVMPQTVAEGAHGGSSRADHARAEAGKAAPSTTDPSKPEPGRTDPDRMAGSTTRPGQGDTRSAPPSDAMAATRSRNPADRNPATESPAVGVGRAPGPDMAMDPGAVFVPGIATARITRGDNLWQISKRIYGRGERYTVIYDANQAQIRDPDLIYPGQIFVLPNDRRG